jgi:hypothetical protein
MADLTAPASTSSCCSAEAQAECCEPSAKASCCGTSAGGGSCGCSRINVAAQRLQGLTELAAQADAVITTAATPAR